MTRPKIGEVVWFRDFGSVASVPEGEPFVVASGLVNGEPLEAEDGKFYVPVWSARDNGRGNTTIMVYSENILPPLEELA